VHSAPQPAGYDREVTTERPPLPSRPILACGVKGRDKGLIPAPQSFSNDAVVSITHRLGALLVAAFVFALLARPLVRLFNPS